MRKVSKFLRSWKLTETGAYVTIFILPLIAIVVSTSTLIWVLKQPIREQITVRIVYKDQARPSMIDILTAAMIIPAEVGDDATDEQFLEILQVAENRAKVTGREVHEEFRARGTNSRTGKSAYMFSPLAGAGPCINKKNLDLYATRMDRVERIMLMPRRLFSATHFYAPELAQPSWARGYVMLVESGKHAFLYDNGEASYKKAKVPKYQTEGKVKTIRPSGKKRKPIQDKLASTQDFFRKVIYRVNSS